MFQAKLEGELGSKVPLDFLLKLLNSEIAAFDKAVPKSQLCCCAWHSSDLPYSWFRGLQMLTGCSSLALTVHWSRLSSLRGPPLETGRPLFRVPYAPALLF